MTPAPDRRVLIETALQAAIAAHRSGNLTEAESRYRFVLTLDGRRFDAVHMLGIVQAQCGNLGEAERLLDDALTICPDHADACFNRGNVQLRRRSFEAALSSYDRAIALKPDHSGAHINRGVALFELGRFARALGSYDQALALKVDNAEVHSNRGNALSKLGRFEEALASHDRAIAINPDYADAYSNRGTVLLDLGQGTAALASHDRAIVLRPNNAEAHFHRGVALTVLGQWEAAVASYGQAIALKPDYADAIGNRGHALMHLRQFEAALASFERLIALKPDFADAHYSRGTVSFILERIDDALASFERAIALKPDFAVARSNAGLLHLLQGDFARGWDGAEWRWSSKDVIRRDFSQPLWSGDADLAGKTILLHGEQGLGDVLQFCRYVPMVAQKGARIILEVQTVLKELMTSVDGHPQVVGAGEPLPDFECHCPLLSLPRAFKTRLESVPAAVPYLSSAQSHREKWKARMPVSKSPRVGLVWAGNPKHGNDHNRSIGLPAMQPLLAHPRAQFFSLQRELREGDADLLRRHPTLMHVGGDLETFADTAAVVSMLDLVISVDTSVVHLAGALGRPVWILLPVVPDWRWLLDREDSPWYPTARLFRRTRSDDDWSRVLADVARELALLF